MSQGQPPSAGYPQQVYPPGTVPPGFPGGPISLPMTMAYGPPAPRGVGVGTVIVISLFCALLVGSAFTAGFWMALRDRLAALSPPAKAAATLAVSADLPALSGLPVAEARKVLGLLGLRLVLEQEQVSDEVPAHTILRQRPLAGSQLRAGSEVWVTLATAPPARPPEAPSVLAAAAPAPPVRPAARSVATPAPAPASRGGAAAVPLVTRLSLGQAKTRLQARGYEVEVEYQAYDEDISPLRVLRQEPAAGAALARGGRVTLTVNPAGD